jgi:hypothetical protein
MNDAKSTNTQHHRNMESLQAESLRSCSRVRHRPSDRQAVGGVWPSALGLRALAGHPATDHRPRASQTSAAGGGCCTNTSLAGDHGLLPRETCLPPRELASRSRRPRSIATFCAKDLSAHLGNAAGPAFRTVRLCAPVTVLAWATYKWT